MAGVNSEVSEKLFSKLSLKAEEEDEEEEEVPPPDEEEEEEEEEEDEDEDEDEEDLIDPADAIKENCAISGCMPLRDRLEECNTRVESKSKTSETCFEEILDFYHCVDHCAAKEIFKNLKWTVDTYSETGEMDLMLVKLSVLWAIKFMMNKWWKPQSRWNYSVRYEIAFVS